MMDLVFRNYINQTKKNRALILRQIILLDTGGIILESFGFWYKLNSAQKGPDYLDQKKETLEQPTIDLHVNFWFLGDIPKHKTNQPYLDWSSNQPIQRTRKYYFQFSIYVT